MAYAALLTLANAAHGSVAGDGSVYDSGILTVSAYTEVNIAFVPVNKGPYAPNCIVFLVDLNGNLIPIQQLNQARQLTALSGANGTGFGASIQLKVFPGMSALPCTFSLSVAGK